MILAAALASRARMLSHTLIPQRGRPAPRGAIAARVVFVLAIVLGLLAFLVMRQMLSLLTEAGGTLDDAAALVALLVNLTLGGLLVFDLHEGVSALLADSDIDLLRRAPIRPPTLLAIKLLDVLPRTSILLLVLVVPAVLAFQDAYGLSAWAWVLLPIQTLSLWALPLGLGAAAAVLLLRIGPARHAREALGLVSTLTLFMLWLANSFLLPRIGLSGALLQDFRGSLQAVAHGLSATPGGWLSQSLTAAVTGHAIDALMGTVRLVAAGTLALGIVTWVAQGSLERVQSRILAAPHRRGAAGAHRARPPAAPTSLASAMLRRDGLLIRRHWTILGDLITTVVLWSLLPAVLGPLFDTAGGLLARAMLLALTVAVGSEVAARAVPLERHALAWSRLAPVRSVEWLGARLLGAACLSGALIALATAASVWALQLDGIESLSILAMIVPALVLALGCGIWAGAAFGDPHWTNPRAMLRPAGRISNTLLLIVQALAWVALAMRVGRGDPAAPWLMAGAAAAAMALAALAFLAGARRLARAEAPSS